MVLCAPTSAHRFRLSFWAKSCLVKHFPCIPALGVCLPSFAMHCSVVICHCLARGLHHCFSFFCHCYLGSPPSSITLTMAIITCPSALIVFAFTTALLLIVIVSCVALVSSLVILMFLFCWFVDLGGFFCYFHDFDAIMLFLLTLLFV